MRTSNRTWVAGGLGAALILGGSIGAAAQQELGGYTWEQLGPVTDRTRTEVISMATLPDGRIGMLGRECSVDVCFEGESTLLGWSSDDGGQSWTESEVDLTGMFPRLVPFGDRFLVADEDRVLASPDALSWEELTKVQDAELNDMVATTDGLAAVGAEHRPAEGWGDELAPYLTLWLSDDGVEWEAHEIAPPRFGPDVDGFAVANGLAHAGDGSWLVTGSGMVFGDGPPEEFALAWHGSPEAGWTEVTMPDGARYGLPWAAPEGFFVTIEFDDFSTGIWRTPDGSEWTQAVDTNGIQAVQYAVPLGEAGLVGFKDAVGLPDGHMTDSADAVQLAGAPTFITLDGETWTQGELLEGIDVESVAVTADGNILAAGGPAPCLQDPPSCLNSFTTEAETPIVMLGTPS